MNKGYGTLRNMMEIIDNKRTISILQVNTEGKAISRFNFLEKKWEDVHETKMGFECTIPAGAFKRSKLFDDICMRKLYTLSSFTTKNIPELYENGVHSMTAFYIHANPSTKEKILKKPRRSWNR